MSSLRESRKRVIVTGGSGFIGSHVVERLINGGHVVICIDDLSSGLRDNLRKFSGHPNLEFIVQDICHPVDIEADEIFHLACPGSPIHYQRNPISTMRTCFLGTHNMLSLAEKYKCKIFHASSGGIYGDPEVMPQREDYKGSVDPSGMRSCYMEGKRIAETLAFDFSRHRDVQIKVGRIFSTYGPGMRIMDGRVISNFLGQALSGDDLTVYGSGMQKRSFCYVDDMVDAIFLMMESDAHITGPQNLGNTEEVSVIDLARMVLDISGAKVRVSHLGFPEERETHRQPDISRAREKLGWEPRIGLRDGLQRTISWFTKHAPERVLLHRERDVSKSMKGIVSLTNMTT